MIFKYNIWMIFKYVEYEIKYNPYIIREEYECLHIYSNQMNVWSIILNTHSFFTFEYHSLSIILNTHLNIILNIHSFYWNICSNRMIFKCKEYLFKKISIEYGKSVHVCTQVFQYKECIFKMIFKYVEFFCEYVIK